MQSNTLFSLNLMYFLLLLCIVIFTTILRQLALKQYRIERGLRTEETTLGSLGDSLSNKPSALFYSFYFLMIILTFEVGINYLKDLEILEIILVPGLVMSFVAAIIYGLYLTMTIRGKAVLRTQRIEIDYKILGNEDLIIQKHLTDLLHESEGDNYTKAEVALRVIDNLKQKESKIGDAVRDMMTNPERFQRMEGTKPVSERWSVLGMIFIVLSIATLAFSVWGVITGYLSEYDVIMKIIPTILVLMVAFVCCLCIERPTIAERKRKERFGI